MPEYAKMYAIVASAASLALDRLETTPENAVARLILKSALLQAEDLYIESADPDPEELPQ